MNQKKIAILYSGGKSLGGIENYLINLFRYIDKKEFAIELLSLGNWPLTERFQVLGYKVKVFSGRRINFGSVKAIGDYCKQNDIKLLVSQGTVANAYARLSAKLYKVLNLVTVHSDASSEYANTLTRNFYRLIDRLLRRYTCHYIAVSKFIKSTLVDSGIPSSKVDVIYNGIDYPSPKSRLHKRLIVGSIGRLDQVKGYDLLIKAFALLDNKRLRLKIAGSGDELNNLRQLVIDLGLTGRVEFVGYKNDVFKFLESVDVYVQPSRCEGFGLALVQAMSQNIPVVITPAGSLTEIVKNGQTGYVSDDLSPAMIAKAISSAIASMDESTKIGLCGGKFARKNFETDKWIKATLATYKDAIK